MTCVVGCCPTMTQEAAARAERNGCEVRTFGSAAQALAQLKAKNLDAIVVGRLAHRNEINGDIREEMLESGYTLVTNRKAFIEYPELASVTIHTAVDKAVAEELLPPRTPIVWHDTKDDALAHVARGDVVLISWDDWRDEFELLVVEDPRTGLKYRPFRCVVQYSYS